MMRKKGSLNSLKLCTLKVHKNKRIRGVKVPILNLPRPPCPVLGMMMMMMMVMMDEKKRFSDFSETLDTEISK